MFMILGRAIADVDASLFEKIGYFYDDGVFAFPIVEQTLSIKGSASCSLDHEAECQNTLFLTYEPEPDHDRGFEEGMKPGLLYRYRGDSPQYKGADFVELKYEYQFGQLKLVAYFLVPTNDCEFASSLKSGGQYTLAELWKDGFIRRTNNG